jgi:myo-inositol-1-phosphate synthase
LRNESKEVKVCEAMNTGVWLIGARGSVATTAMVGAAAVQAGLADTTGCVTELPDFAAAGLAGVGGFVFGGHEIVDIPLPKRAERLAEAGVVPARLPELVRHGLEAADAEIVTLDEGEAGRQSPRVPQAEVAARLAADITGFAERHGLARVVVVNLASTEPPAAAHPAHGSLPELERALTAGPGVLPPSALYAYAAMRAGCAYVDFTPSTGARLPALDELARAAGLPYAGRDAKTGETLMKSVLAPMFARRALRVRSWSGTNLLGGGDGETLADPATAASKSSTKRRLLGETLGYPIEQHLHIDHVADLGEWKTAWDHVTFEGFLGVRMTLQFTWQGCDSALAAPLVLDLARLMARAHEAGESGPVGALGFFFKDPIATTEHDLAAQYRSLVAWANDLDDADLHDAHDPHHTAGGRK